MIARLGLALLVALTMPAAISSASSRAPAAAPAPSPAPAAPAEEKPAPQSIRVPEVAAQADEVGRLVRDFDALLVPGPASVTAEKRLPEIASRIGALGDETSRAIEAQPAAATLDTLTDQWQTTRWELVGYVNALARRATVTEEALERLTDLQDTWTRTRAEALTSRAPVPVIERVDAVLTSIASARKRLQDRRAVVLVLQDRVAREVAQCEAMLERIAQARQGAAGG